MSFNVGLNVLEVDGKAAPSIQAAPTSVTGFVIKSQRGIPGRVYRVTNWSQFVENFGSYKSDAYGAYGVRGFFDNGGTIAMVTRVVHSAVPPTPARLTSNDGPWNLEVGSADQLLFESDLWTGTKPALFEWNPARIVGLGDLNLDNGTETDTGKVLRLGINGRPGEEHQFLAADFEYLAAATPQEVVQVLNREFVGIRAYVDDSGNLVVSTDRGKDSSLELQTPADPAVNAAEALFGATPVVEPGGGNVAHIDAVTPAEAATVIGGALDPDGVVVTQDGPKVRIEHLVPGSDGQLAVDWNSSAILEGTFEFQSTDGSDGDPSAGPVASSATFLAENDTPALEVTAGYRGEEDPGIWSKFVENGIKQGIEVEISTPYANDQLRFDLTVYFNGDEVETWRELTMKEPSAGAKGTQVEAAINDTRSGSKYITVETKNGLRPAEVGPTGLAGGSDGGSLVASDFIASFDSFKLHEIQLLCCPETSDNGVVTKGIGHCREMNDRMFAGHTPEGDDAGAAEGYGIDLQGDKVYGALYFPWIQVADPLGVNKWIPPTGHVLGVYARTERERGIWKAPAGNAARLSGALDVKFHITDVDHTTLVKSGSVNAVRFIPGKGIIIDSSRTLSTSPLWLYVNVRLLFNFVKSSLKSGLRWAVQEPNDETLWNKIKFNTVRPFLMGLWRRGAFGSGAPDDVFTIKVDAENNPLSEVQVGKLTVEVYFYPSRPAETIVIIIGQQEAGGSASEG